VCAWLAISGVPFTSGFFSKDEILLAAYAHAPWMFWIAVLTAGMTAFYVARAIFLAFFGEYRGDAHPHESPLSMTLPLVALAALSIFGGYLPVLRWLEPLLPMAAHENSLAKFVAISAGFIGIGLAWVFYVLRPELADTIAGRLGFVYRAVLNKYYVDEIYNGAVVNPVVNGSRTVLWKQVDAGMIDGAVNGVGGGARGIGGVLRLLQSGNIRSYAAWVLLGSVGVLIAMAARGLR
jgi:NADH-quinone oxidoreductase subunit L